MIVPSAISKVSPWLYVVFVGAVTSIFDIAFSTVISNVVVCPSYPTVTVFVPAVVVNVFNAGVTVTSESVNATVCVSPAALFTVISPPANL